MISKRPGDHLAGAEFQKAIFLSETRRPGSSNKRFRSRRRFACAI
jgi:hypothetical protein